jgi:hypothetical protein
MRSNAPSDTSCPDCQEIIRELREVYGEAYLRAPDASDALRSLAGGTEQDAERADELLRPYQYQASPGLPSFPPRLRDILHRSALHFLRTGHLTKAAWR